MEIKYHVAPEGPRRCVAFFKPCKYAEAGQEHYATYEEAEKVYAERMKSTFGVFSTKRSLSDKVRISFYKKTNLLLEKVIKVKLAADDINRKTALALKAIKASPERMKGSASSLGSKLKALSVSSKEKAENSFFSSLAKAHILIEEESEKQKESYRIMKEAWRVRGRMERSGFSAKEIEGKFAQATAGADMLGPGASAAYISHKAERLRKMARTRTRQLKEQATSTLAYTLAPIVSQENGETYLLRKKTAERIKLGETIEGKGRVIAVSRMTDGDVSIFCKDSKGNHYTEVYKVGEKVQLRSKSLQSKAKHLWSSVLGSSVVQASKKHTENFLNVSYAHMTRRQDPLTQRASVLSLFKRP